jgi:hypothetical protein
MSLDFMRRALVDGDRDGFMTEVRRAISGRQLVS